MKHYLKIEKPYYDAVLSGHKCFEIRVNDRDYQKGDTIELRCLNEKGTTYASSAKPITATITYVTGYQQRENWVVFGFKRIT